VIQVESIRKLLISSSVVWLSGISS
jgi:hypothetical protein